MGVVVTPDATAAFLAKEIAEAREALLAVCRENPEREWRAYELKAKARNGWGDGAMNLALRDLIEEGILDAEGDCVRLSG